MDDTGQASRADVLVLLAFDNTLVDVDSSLHISQMLAADVAGSMWTNCAKNKHGDRARQMDEFFMQLAKEQPQVSSDDIRNAAESLPCSTSMVDAIRLAADGFGASCKVVSDAAVFSVQSFLQRHELTSRVDEVVANPTHFEERGKVLRVRPYVDDHFVPHGCPKCPRNLCKGAVLERILQHHRYARVFYVGDGAGDFCPSTKLAEDDVVFARASQVGGKSYDLLPLLQHSADAIQAHVRQWKTGDDILAYFRDFFYRQYPECRHRNTSATSVYTEQAGNFSIPSPMPRNHGELLIVFDVDPLLVHEGSTRTLDPIRERVAQIPGQTRMSDAIRMAVELFGADVNVVSNGSTFCIESLQNHGEQGQHVKEVFATLVEQETVDDGRTKLRIRPCHAKHLEPQECAWCPSDTCKGNVLDSLRSGKSYSRVIYVGDGAEDFCPATRLSTNDIVLARSHVINREPYEMLVQINANPGIVQAPVVPWSTGYDIYRRFAQFCPAPYAIPHGVPRIAGRVLVIFDYDWSLINDNSDTFIFHELYPELLSTLRERCARQSSWTKVMDDMLRTLAEDKPDTTSDMIRAAVARVPIQPHMLDALRLAAELYGADVKIVSDANSVYIESMLQHYGLTQDVGEIVTNPASFESLDNGHNRLRVHPYHADNREPHGCEWCPTNMCKGRIVDALRSAHPYPSVLYVGDGSGDFCAATRLNKSDIVFARADEADGRSYGLQKRIDSNPTLVDASVVPWSTGDDIYRHFAQFFHASLCLA